MNLIKVILDSKKNNTVIADGNGNGQTWEKAQMLVGGGEGALLVGLTHLEWVTLIDSATEAGFLPKSQLDEAALEAIYSPK